MRTGTPEGWSVNDFEMYGTSSMPIARLEYYGQMSKEEILMGSRDVCSPVWGSNYKIPSNRLYFGDNLPVLRTLLDESTVRGEVRLIYIDPPFASNNAFQSRSQVVAYDDFLSGAAYIEFIRQRLIILRELLADNGSIYVHLDGRMVFHIKILMDELFGVDNFRNMITRQKCHPKNYTKNSFGNVADYILFYTKSNNYVWNRPMLPWTEEHRKKEYPFVEPDTGRRYKRVPLHAPGTRNGDTGKPWRGISPPPGKHWQYRRETLDRLNEAGEIYWSVNGNPRRKVYADQSEGVPVQDIWLDVKDQFNQNSRITGYPTEKNIDLLTRLIDASSDRGDLVLDCFSGSGTTLEAANLLGRRWIGIDNSLEAIDTVVRRMRFGPRRMGDYVRWRSKAGSTEISATSQPTLFDMEQRPQSHLPGGLQYESAQEDKLDFTLFVSEGRWSEFSARATQ